MYDYVFVAIKHIWYILLFDLQNLALRQISSNLNVSGPQLRKTFPQNINAYVFMIFNSGFADFREKSRVKNPHNSTIYWNRNYFRENVIKTKIYSTHFHEKVRMKNSQALFSQTYIWKALAYMTVMIIKFYVRNI